MPSLNKDQFLAFYQYLITGVTVFSGKDQQGQQVEYLDSAAAAKDPTILMKEVNWDLTG